MVDSTTEAVRAFLDGAGVSIERIGLEARPFSEGVFERELYTIVPKYVDTPPDLRHYCVRKRRESWLAKRPGNTIARASLSLN